MRKKDNISSTCLHLFLILTRCIDSISKINQVLILFHFRFVETVSFLPFILQHNNVREARVWIPIKWKAIGPCLSSHKGVINTVYRIKKQVFLYFMDSHNFKRLETYNKNKNKVIWANKFEIKQKTDFIMFGKMRKPWINRSTLTLFFPTKFLLFITFVLKLSFWIFFYLFQCIISTRI